MLKQGLWLGAALMLSACAAITPAPAPAPTLAQELATFGPEVDAVAATVMADASVSATVKTDVQAAQEVFDDAVKALAAAPVGDGNLPALAANAVDAINTLVPLRPLTTQEQSDVQLALQVIEAVVTAA